MKNRNGVRLFLGRVKRKIYELNRVVMGINIDQSTMDAATRHRSFDSMSGILGWVLTLAKLEFSDFTLEGTRTLEIGTGKFFTHALGLYVCGCTEVISIDKYRQLSPEAIKAAMSNPVLARRFLSVSASHDDFMNRLSKIQETGFDLQKLEALGIKYRAPIDLLEHKEYRGTFDFVFSYTVFEHVPENEISSLINESVLAMRPGGFCMHFVDIEDHFSYYNSKTGPFAFLSADIDWDESKCFERGNRLRFSVWQDLFLQHEGMEWRFPYVAVQHNAEIPLTIDKNIKHQNEDDLRTSAFLVVGKKL